MAPKLDATVENVPCRSTTGGASDRHCGSLTPAIPTDGSALPADGSALPAVGARAAGVGAVDTAELVTVAGADDGVPETSPGDGDAEPGGAEGVGTVIGKGSFVPDSASGEEGAASESEIGANAGTGSAEQPTTTIVARAAASATVTRRRRGSWTLRMSRQR